MYTEGLNAYCTIYRSFDYMDLPLHFLCSWRAFSADIICYGFGQTLKPWRRSSGMREYRFGAQSAPGAGQCRIKWNLFPFEEYGTRPFIASPWVPSQGCLLQTLCHRALAGRILIVMLSVFWKSFSSPQPRTCTHIKWNYDCR